MAKELAIVLNDGGLSAAVATAIIAQKHRPVMVYGETLANPTSRRRAAYELQVSHFKPIREHTLSIAQDAGLDRMQTAASPVADPRVPDPLTPRLLRLLPLLSAATRLAAQHDATALCVGLSVGGKAEDVLQATEYLQIWAELVQMTCGLPNLDVQAPLLELEPWQVVDLGVQVGAPLEKTWTCREDGAEPCGVCRGCRIRDLAFQQSAKADPLRHPRKTA